MALTIRTLSEEAERTLSEVQNNNENINTNSKAIEFVLENYLSKCRALEDEKSKNLKLQNQLFKAKEKLGSIAKGFEVITKMIAK
jgi:hypothetical protein